MLVAAPVLAYHPDTETIDKEKVLDMMASPGLVILDVRMIMDYSKSNYKIKGAQRTSMKNLANWIASVPKDCAIVVYCNSSNDEHSSTIANKLQNLGMEKVYFLKGGWEGWNDVGYPVEKK